MAKKKAKPQDRATTAGPLRQRSRAKAATLTSSLPKRRTATAAEQASEAAAAETTTGSPAQPNLPTTFIVGIGASAGGLDATSQLLGSIGAETRMSFVLVQHASPDHETLLIDILKDRTRLSVHLVSDGVELKPSALYITPPGASITVESGFLRVVRPTSERHSFMPIDAWFRSLAEYAQERAIGIVLSGTASDGAEGLRAIKASGGITLAQDPETAEFGDMPRAAVSTGVVDLVLPPARIGAELKRIEAHPLVRRKLPMQQPELVINPETLERVISLLRTASGVNFVLYKAPTIKRRLHRRMVLHKLSSAEQYLKYLEENPSEVLQLYSDILIHVTRFFRDPESFTALSREVFPKIVEHRERDSAIRIWVPGCSTGEEAYSIAIALLDYLGDRASVVPVQLFATDISEAAIEHARCGAYLENIAADLSPERLRRFFTKSDGKYRISKAVRDLCVFARQDLTRDPPFSKLDLIVCRNVLIYLGPQLQKRLMSVFHYGLKQNGFLMLGAAETNGQHADLFGTVNKKHRIYSKKSSVAPRDLPVPFDGEVTATVPEVSTAAKNANDRQASAMIDRAILDRYSPPGVVVDSELQIIGFRGQTGEFLEPAPGNATLNLLKMARDGMVHSLRSALHEARRTSAPVRKEGVRVVCKGQVRGVTLQVVPIDMPEQGRHYLVLFEQAPSTDHMAAPVTDVVVRSKTSKEKTKAADADRRVEELQHELIASRDYAQSVIQDLEAANEELQSANEEILSSNEELQSTNEELDAAKEELQSSNEELNTVNEELFGRNEELSRVNSDLINLLSNVQIAIAIISNDLRIRRLTPMAEKVLNLMPSDVGRPLSQIKPNIQCEHLEELVREVIDSVTVVEREVRDHEGRWYSLRIRPYKNVDSRIDGAVMALFEIHPSDAVLDNARQVLEMVRQPMVLLDAHLRVQRVNKAFSEAFEVPSAETRGEPLYKLGDDQWNSAKLRLILADLLASNQPVENCELEHDFPRIGWRKIRISARQLDRPEDRQALVLMAVEDITQDSKVD